MKKNKVPPKTASLSFDTEACLKIRKDILKVADKHKIPHLDFTMILYGMVKEFEKISGGKFGYKE